MKTADGVEVRDGAMVYALEDLEPSLGDLRARSKAVHCYRVIDGGLHALLRSRIRNVEETYSTPELAFYHGSGGALETLDITKPLDQEQAAKFIEIATRKGVLK